ncbi:MAG: shikimate kinase [Johnsonella sp.]|nr:shikimate kinase [Johnsonella sp.]
METKKKEESYRSYPGGEKFLRNLERVQEAVSASLREEAADPFLIAIEGRAAAGKTSFGGALAKSLDANLWHMDDFFLQSEQRTFERLQEIGGNVDYERFEKEVLRGLLARREVLCRKFDCSQMRILDLGIKPYKRINIIEGIYSTHPYFSAPYALKIFMEISEEEQRRRILLRNEAEDAEKFFSLWIPKENAYIEKFGVKEKADILIFN